MKIFLCIVSCLVFVSCFQGSFNWKPNPYFGDSVNQRMVDSDGQAISCSDEKFNEIVGFTIEDIAAWKKEMERVNRLLQSCGYNTKKEMRKIRKAFRDNGF